MEKIVINCTEGGAKISGCKQISLKDAINKYCINDIDKSKIIPLLSLADNSDKLIEDVIPLLKKDIDNLNKIILQSKRGLAANRGLNNLIKRKNYKRLLTSKKERKFNKLISDLYKKEKNAQNIVNLFYQRVLRGLKKSKLKNIIFLSYKNHIASENAHITSEKNPLVKVAIYGAARQIQGKDLNVDGNIINFLKNNRNALVRIKRNTIILTTAKNAAKSLKKSYEKTYKLLKEYNKTKDNNLLISNEEENINLDDAETYFKAGNWAHPLLDSIKFIDKINNPDIRFAADLKETDIANAKQIYTKAINMRTVAIEKAKKYEEENSDHEKKLLKYNDLLRKAKKMGREEKKFEEALKLIKKASELLPKETEARWGLATAYHHSGKIDESLNEYQKLIKDFPNNHMFKFEYGQVLLANLKIKEGIAEICEVMEKTGEYDNFYARLGSIYEYIDMKEEALSAYNSYLKKYPFDYKIMHKKADCLEKLGRKKLAKKARKRAYQIKPK